MQTVHIIGAGLAGSEAAWFLAERGVKVVLHEMRPALTTLAHKTGSCAELVCSNSLKSKSPVSAPGIMKAEMKMLDSLILAAAGKAEVPAGEALAVERDVFSGYITEKLRSHPNVTFVAGEVSEPWESSTPGAEEITLIATGPLTSEPMTRWLVKATGADDLYFYDAIAPIVDASTIDPEASFTANRYDKGGEEAYINCPMSEEEYENFIDAIIQGEKVPTKNFEKEKYFQGCQPIEAIAATGRDSLRFGPMKPVGLTDPKTGRRPYAAVQLRAENRSRTAYNIVGFQTRLKYGAQTKALRMIPALKNAEFLRMGSMHRNTYVCGPKVLRPDLSLKGYPRVYLAGQITGVEGYLESAACGLLAAISILARVRGLPHRAPPANTALGALLSHVTASDEKNYQPNNIQFALFDPKFFEETDGLKKDALRETIARQAPGNFNHWMNSCSTLFS
ncbi:methylenetetrahydrofolate--tRNA-(uracil(54)-C(5))-methyltransferase (FADH(2)-oxidizing) TrmFO [bacterium]|jgi:methylenetetrahydrofolate--tRNA-(uracil-5-)-methyltransferase|nr:methylenetetrahydrofolate--tRNA-(uracil(54)-C(5))-methyltransferase (FADH(2)-oxidizing) TrmFO [bacterium]